jgi:hypothetical protein
MKECPSCKIRIEADLSECPNCGALQQARVNAPAPRRIVPQRPPIPSLRPQFGARELKGLIIFGGFAVLIVGFFLAFGHHNRADTPATVSAQEVPAGTPYLQSFTDIKNKYGMPRNTYAGSQVQGGQRYEFQPEGIMRLVVETDGDHCEYIEYNFNHKWTQEQLETALNANGTGWQQQSAGGFSASIAAGILHVSSFVSQEGHVASFNDIMNQLQITSAELQRMRQDQKAAQDRKNAQMPRF